jgi:hypothetical protein
MADLEIPSPNPNDMWKRLLQKKNDPASRSESIVKNVEDIEDSVEKEKDSVENVSKLIGKAYTEISKISIEKDAYFDKILKSVTGAKQGIISTYTSIEQKVEKSFKAFEVWRKEKTKDLTRALLLSPTQRAGIELYETIKTTISKTYENISRVVKDVSALISAPIIAGYEFAKTCLSCMSSFVFGIFKSGWKILDSLLTTLGGPVWGAIKSIIGAGISTVKWVVSFGVDALGFIWSGVKTIFSFTFGPVITASKYLIGGAKVFFDWWFKMLIKTVLSFSPLNVILFGVITGTILLGIGALLVAGGVVASTIIKPVLAGVFKVTQVIGNWVWNGITLFFDWIKQQYDDSPMFKKVVEDAWAGITKTFHSWFGGESILKSAFIWIKDAYNWLTKSGRATFDKISKQFEKVQNFINKSPSGTILSGFIEFLKKFESVPGVKTALKILGNTVGVSTSGQLNAIREQLRTQKKNTFRDILEHNILQMKKDDFTDAQIKDRLQNDIVPKLSHSFELEEKDTQDAIEEATKTAQNAYEGKVGLVDAKFIEHNLHNIGELQVREAQALQGDIDENGQKQIDDFLSRNREFQNQENTVRNVFGIKGGALTSDEAQDLLNYANSAFETFKTSRQTQSRGEFDQLENPNNKGQSAWEQFSTNRSLIGGGQGALRELLPISQFLAFGGQGHSELGTFKISEDNTQTSSRTEAALGVSTSLPNLPEFGGTGGIFDPLVGKLMAEHFDGKGYQFTPGLKTTLRNRLVEGLTKILKGDNPENEYKLLMNLINNYPNMPMFVSEMTQAAKSAISKRNPSFKGAKGLIANGFGKILPLDASGQEFIKEQVKGIKLADDKKTPLKEELRNITIIEETVANKESYQIYTISQMAKGILGV